MPEDVANVLEAAGVRADYDARPDYQRNDYIMWIEKAKTQPTRQKRIDQMVDELARGGVYMRMEHKPSRKA